MARSDAAVDVNNLVDGWLLLEECRDAGDVRACFVTVSAERLLDRLSLCH